MQDFVECPNPALGDWAPCPYARQARINNKIKIVFSEPHLLKSTLDQSIDLLDNYEVVVIAFDHRRVKVPVFVQDVADWNQELMKNNLVILEDHPDYHESVNGVGMNFGHCGLLIVQYLDKLNQAADQLRSKGYYDTWDQKQYSNVVEWRYKQPTHTV
jgi:hypothetical protein